MQPTETRVQCCMIESITLLFCEALIVGFMPNGLTETFGTTTLQSNSPYAHLRPKVLRAESRVEQIRLQRSTREVQSSRVQLVNQRVYHHFIIMSIMKEMLIIEHSTSTNHLLPISNDRCFVQLNGIGQQGTDHVARLPIYQTLHTLHTLHSPRGSIFRELKNNSLVSLYLVNFQATVLPFCQPRETPLQQRRLSQGLSDQGAKRGGGKRKEKASN